MRSKDKHLGTGEYNPQKYWEARAKFNQGNTHQAVCEFRLSDAENAAMEKIQAHVFASIVKSLNLQGAKVMEFGCGVGRWAPFILKRGAS